jgi:hypothetical protein
MTDLSGHPAPLFNIPFRSEAIETELFGTVTVHEIPARRLSALYDECPPEAKGEDFGHNLLCETVTGPNGEHFTMELLRDLPNRALKDMAKLLRTAVRINGISRDEVEKA